MNSDVPNLVLNFFTMVPNLGCMLESFRSFKKHCCLGLIPELLIEWACGCDLGIRIFFKHPQWLLCVSRLRAFSFSLRALSCILSVVCIIVGFRFVYQIKKRASANACQTLAEALNPKPTDINVFVMSLKFLRFSKCGP